MVSNLEIMIGLAIFTAVFAIIMLVGNKFLGTKML